jgi:oligopeptide transport system substrate-binding protein
MTALRSAPECFTGALRRFWRLGILCLVAALIPTGCVRHEPRADLVILNGAEPESLDPGIITGQPDLRIAGSIFEGLARYDPVTGGPVPGLAERWEISPDGRRYRFYLRTNAVWSTGEPITAHDFVWSWQRVLDPKTGGEYAGQLFYVKNAESFNTGQLTDPGRLGIRAPDDRTLEVELNAPTAFFLSLCCFQTLAVVPRDLIERHGDRWLMARPFKASGPYALESWRINDKVRLRKNPRYWDAASTRCEVVDLLPITSPNTALNLYESGAADIVWDKNLVPNELLDVLLKRPDFHTFDYLGSYFVRFNVTRAPFNDARVRQAFAVTMDKQRIVGKITRGGEKVALSHTPPGTASYTPPEGLPHDPSLGRRLLAEAGYPGGQGFPRVVYLFNGGSGARSDEKIAVELQDMWRRELGVNVELRAMEWKTYLAAQNRLEYDLCRSSWIADYNDPNTFLDMFMSNNGNNRTGWRSEEYDGLIRRANELADLDRRAALLREAEMLLLRRDTPIAPIYFYAGVNFYNPAKIEGIWPNIIDQHPINAIRRKGMKSDE